MTITILLAFICYTALIVILTALVFLRKFDKLRFEHFDKVVGTLHVEPAEDGETAMIFLELYKGTGDISNREFVHLTVENASYITQK